MKQIDYKGVVIRPRMITFDEYQQQSVNSYMERFRKEKADPEHYKGAYYEQTEEEFESYVKKYLANDRLYWDRQTHWFVSFSNGRVVRIPKRKYTEDDTKFFARIDKVIAKVNKESKTEYGKFAAMMQRMVEDKVQRSTYLIYPTTYGIGVWAMYNFNFEEDCKRIESVLKGMGVEYTNEFSDANWAYRFKISKKEANRKLIEKQIK